MRLVLEDLRWHGLRRLARMTPIECEISTTLGFAPGMRLVETVRLPAVHHPRKGAGLLFEAAASRRLVHCAIDANERQMAEWSSL